MRNIILALAIGAILGIGLFVSVQDYLRVKTTLKNIITIIQQSQQAAEQNRLVVKEAGQQ